MRLHHVALLLAATACISPDDDDTELATAISEANVHQWSDDRQISGQASDYQVGLAQLGTRLHLVYRADNDNLVHPEIMWSRFNGTSWTTPTQIPSANADYGPALTVFNNRLTMVWNTYGQNRIQMSTSDGVSWTAPVTAGTSIGSATYLYAPAVATHEGVLYLGYCKRGSDGAESVQIDRFNGTSWTLQASWPVPSTSDCKSVALASLPNRVFQVVWNRECPGCDTIGSDWKVSEARGVGAPSSSWQQRVLSMKSKKPLSVVHCDGLTHLVHGGFSNPSEIWWTTHENGDWLGDVRVPNQASYGGAALGCFNNRTFMVHNGGYPQLWWSEYSGL